MSAQCPRSTRLLNAPFILAALTLAVAAIWLNAAIGYLQLSFKKLPVPLERPLTMVAADLGPWRQISRDEPLEAELQAALGTEQYIFRWYADERVVGASLIQRLQKLPQRQRAAEVAALQRSRPEAVVSFAVTYYTGLVDTVAHIPERCYVAGGFEPVDPRIERWTVGGRPLGVRVISFEDAGEGGKSTRTVAYFFSVNGRFEESSLQVRYTLQDLRQRYGYYAKVELMMTSADAGRCQKVLSDFLEHALPDVQKSLPAWPVRTATR